MLGKKKDEVQPEKKNWYNDRYQRVVVQRNIYALLALLAFICSIAATFSISQLVPLKSVEPFVIQVDPKSGITQVVDPLKAKELSAKESINNYFMVQYIRARESYLGSPGAGVYNYNLVRVFSDRSVFSKYQYDISTGNPDSPAARLGAGTREVKISSIKFLDKHSLPANEESLRFIIVAVVIERPAGGGKEGCRNKY